MRQAAAVDRTRIGTLAFATIVAAGGCTREPTSAGRAFRGLDLRRCKPAPGTTGSPNSVDEAIALLNGLSFPVTAACFIEALDRPLRIEASKSRASAQPANGARSPRLFVFSGDALVITAALEGEGRDLIEFGEHVCATRSVKAELAFPLSAPVPRSAAFDRIRNEEHGNITTCFVCHDAERDEPGFPGGRSSLVMRPRTKSLIPIDALQAAYETCAWSAEPGRCAMLEAVVAWGPLEHHGFDEALPTF